MFAKACLGKYLVCAHAYTHCMNTQEVRFPGDSPRHCVLSPRHADADVRQHAGVGG